MDLMYYINNYHEQKFEYRNNKLIKNLLSFEEKM